MNRRCKIKALIVVVSCILVLGSSIVLCVIVNKIAYPVTVVEQIKPVNVKYLVAYQWSAKDGGQFGFGNSTYTISDPMGEEKLTEKALDSIVTDLKKANKGKVIVLLNVQRIE
jgi:hypothetical protein